MKSKKLMFTALVSLGLILASTAWAQDPMPSEEGLSNAFPALKH